MTVTVDLTGVAVAAISVVLPVLGTVALAWLSSHIKDQAARTVIQAAVKNSLGVLQQAATSEIQQMRPTVDIPGVPPKLAAGVQHVLDQAGPELARFPDITPERIAEKIEAQIGLENIKTNAAITANASSAVAAPLAPVVNVSG